MISAEERATAIRETQNLAGRFRQAGISGKLVNAAPGAVTLVRELARERTPQGDFLPLLTRCLRLPDVWQAVTLSVLLGKHPYEDDGAAARVTLRNIGESPIPLLVGKEWIADQRRDTREGWVEGETGQEAERTRMLGPGEETELPVRFAIHNLLRYSRSAYQPIYWESSSAIPERDDLSEVAYRCPSWGEEFSGRHREEPPARKERKAA